MSKLRTDRAPILVTLLVAAGVVLGIGSALFGATRPMRFERLSLEEGLSQNTVLALLQDSRGFLWLGTEDGLNRFDGYSFTHYRHEADDPQSLASSYIWAIAEDPEGNLWIGTDGGGVARWDRASDRFTRFRHDPDDAGSLASDHIRSLFVDQQGIVWVGTRNRGLDRLQPRSGRVTHFRHDPADEASLSNDEIFAIVGDPAGGLWIGTNAGLDRFDPETVSVERFRNDPDAPATLSDDRIRSLFVDHRGSLWVGTAAGGLNRLDPRAEGFERYLHDPQDPTSLSHSRVRAILEDDARRLWVGTLGGLDLLDRERDAFVRFAHDAADPDSLSNNEVMALLQDRGGLLWVGTKSGGVNKWNPRTWSFGHFAADPSNPRDLASPVVTSFSVDALGRLWVGTVGGGLNRLDRVTGEWSRFQHRPGDPTSLSDDRVMALLHDHRGLLWVGTYSGGLNRYDSATSTFQVFRHDPAAPGSLSADAIMSLFEDDRGRVWAGTFGGGVSRFDRRTQTFARLLADSDDPDGSGGVRVTSFAQDLTGAIWIGTDGAGLQLLDADGELRRFRHDPDDPAGLSSDTIYALHVDAAGTLWVGTRDGWLQRVEGSSQAPDKITFTTFSAKSGLVNADIYGIQSDAKGNLWLSSNGGLSRFNPRLQTVKNYTPAHGLQAMEFNFGAHHRGTTGELFFGGINGFNAFFPTQIRENPQAPQVALTRIQVNNEDLAAPKSLDEPERLELGFRDHVATFEFAALDFLAPSENRFAYMLEGFDPEWVELESDNRVTYTNLDAGDYTLRVKAANNDGVWSEAETTLAVSVQPAPWESWWAYTGYSSALVLLGVAFVRRQQRKVTMEADYSRRLELEVEERTVELQERNTELEGLNNRLLEASLTDSLTGLRNRRFLFEQVAKDIALVRRRYYEVHAGEQQPEIFDLVFMMVDLDHFKSINDSCGHVTGDQVLVEMRDVLLEAVRASDIVIRWGGDEFLIIGRDADPAKASVLAERVRANIESRVLKLRDGHVVRLTCSVGFACYPFVRAQPDAVSWEQVLQLADSALYAAKQQRNAWVGFKSTQKSLSREGIVRMIRETPGDLVETGDLEILGPAQASPPEPAPSEPARQTA